MLLKNQTEAESAIRLYGQIIGSLEAHKDLIYKHEKVKDSLVFLNKAIPEPTVDTVPIWNKLFRGWFPYPLIQIPEQAAVISSINPATYGIDRNSIMLPTRQSALSLLYGQVPGKYEAGFGEGVPQIQVLHMLATSGFHLMSMNPFYQSQLRPIPKVEGEYLVGMTFILTDFEYTNQWCVAYDRVWKEFNAKRVE